MLVPFLAPPGLRPGGVFVYIHSAFWYNVNMKKQKERMPYEAYRYILDLIEADEERLEIEYRVSFNFISPQDLKAARKAYEYYQKKAAIIRKAKLQFQEAIKASYKDCPSEKMRKFWGVPSLSKE